MPLPKPVCKVVLSGTMLTGKEIWSASLSLDTDSGGQASGSIRDTLLPALVTAATTWFRSDGARIHSSAELRTIKANMLDVDGKYASDSETLFVDIEAGTVRGAIGTNLLPPQSTAAVSLLTARSRGLASRGRFYPPALSAGLDANTGGMLPATTDAMAKSAADFLSAINAVPGYTVVVASDVREGRIEPVTRVAVGSIVDTQRRRRSALPEVYAFGGVTPG